MSDINRRLKKAEKVLNINKEKVKRIAEIVWFADGEVPSAKNGKSGNGSKKKTETEEVEETDARPENINLETSKESS